MKRKRGKRKRPYTETRWSATNTVDALIVDTTDEERLRVFEICSSIGKYIATLLMAAGALSTFLFLECFLGVQLFSTPQLKILLIIAMGFIGIMNLVCGLLLLAME